MSPRSSSDSGETNGDTPKTKKKKLTRSEQIDANRERRHQEKMKRQNMFEWFQNNLMNEKK